MSIDNIKLRNSSSGSGTFNSNNVTDKEALGVLRELLVQVKLTNLYLAAWTEQHFTEEDLGHGD